jgi:hypothetical protein
LHEVKPLLSDEHFSVDGALIEGKRRSQATALSLVAAL